MLRSYTFFAGSSCGLIKPNRIWHTPQKYFFLHKILFRAVKVKIRQFGTDSSQKKKPGFAAENMPLLIIMWKLWILRKKKTVKAFNATFLRILVNWGTRGTQGNKLSCYQRCRTGNKFLGDSGAYFTIKKQSIDNLRCRYEVGHKYSNSFLVFTLYSHWWSF